MAALLNMHARPPWEKKLDPLFQLCPKLPLHLYPPSMAAGASIVRCSVQNLQRSGVQNPIIVYGYTADVDSTLHSLMGGYLAYFSGGFKVYIRFFN